MILINELFHRILVAEAKEPTKKPMIQTTGHMTHIADWSMYGDPLHGLSHMETMADWFDGKETEGHSVSIKADGGVSVVVGRRHDGTHFISYKSGKKLFHSPDEIDAAGVPWAEDGKRILAKVQEMNIKAGTAFQGDVLWAHHGELQDGHARPNTVRYKPTHHPMSIAVHGQYNILDNGDLIRTSNAPDISQLKHPEVNIPNLQLKAGSIRLSKTRRKAVRQSLRKARKALTPETQEYLKGVSQNKDVHKLLQEYMNEVVATTGKRSVDDLRKYIHEPLSTAVTSSAYKNKATQRNMKEDKRNKLIQDLEKHIGENSQHLENLFTHHGHLADAKHHMLDQLKETHGLHDLIPGHGHEHEGLASVLDGIQAKMTREGPGGFSEQNRARGVERGFFKPQPVQEEMTASGGAVSGMGYNLGGPPPDDVAVYPRNMRRYKRKSRSPIVGRFMKQLRIGTSNDPY